MNTITITRLSKIFILALGILAFPTQSFGQSETSYMEVDDDTKKITIKNQTNDYKIEYEGEITTSDDDKDIVAISEGGFIEIKKSRFGKKRKITIEAEGDRLVKKYYIGRKEVSWNPDGKNWLAEILPDLVRRTGIAAKSRVDRFYNKGGVKAVVNEVDDLKSDYVKAIYVKLLLKKDLNDNELVLAIDAVDDIDSDYYKASIVSSIIKDNSVNDKQVSSLLQITKSIDSDYYKAQILSYLMKNRDMNSNNVGLVLSLSRDIDSDYYSAVVLSKALKLDNLSNDNYDKFLSSISNIDSDYYTAEVINKSLLSDVNDENLTKLIDIIEDNVDSDHYATVIYKTLSKAEDLNDAQVTKILNGIGETVGSDYYLATALSYYSSYVKDGGSGVKEAYTQAAKKIDNETYFGKAMKAVY